MQRCIQDNSKLKIAYFIKTRHAVANLRTDMLKTENTPWDLDIAPLKTDIQFYFVSVIQTLFIYFLPVHLH